MIGVYRIDGPNNKIYIGSSIDIDKRWKEHRQGERSNVKLQRAIKKYGLSAFKFSIIEFVDDIKDLLRTEQIWLDILFTSLDESEIYNISRFAGSAMLGRTHSEESKRKNRESNLGKEPPNKGKPMSSEQKLKLSEARKGMKLSEATRHKISESNRIRWQKYKNET